MAPILFASDRIKERRQICLGLKAFREMVQAPRQTLREIENVFVHAILGTGGEHINQDHRGKCIDSSLSRAPRHGHLPESQVRLQAVKRDGHLLVHLRTRLPAPVTLKELIDTGVGEDAVNEVTQRPQALPHGNSSRAASVEECSAEHTRGDALTELGEAAFGSILVEHHGKDAAIHDGVV